MSDDTQETQVEENTPSELDLLKQRADLMGITYHPNIGVDKLKAKINAITDSDAESAPDSEPEPDLTPAPAPVVKSKKAPPKPKNYKPMTKREMQLHEAQKLVRVRITCMNPNKREYTGEIFTFGNRSIKSYRKFVPYNTPWMIPVFLVNMIRSKKVQLFKTVTRNGQKIREGYLISEYAVEELPGPSQEELDRLRTKQAAQQSLDDE